MDYIYTNYAFKINIYPLKVVYTIFFWVSPFYLEIILLHLKHHSIWAGFAVIGGILRLSGCFHPDLILTLYFIYLNSKNGFIELIALGGKKPFLSLFITVKKGVQSKCPTVREWVVVIHLEKCSLYVQWETKLSSSRQVIQETEKDQKKSQFIV